jgi:hypothetical protein
LIVDFDTSDKKAGYKPNRNIEENNKFNKDINEKFNKKINKDKK